VIPTVALTAYLEHSALFNKRNGAAPDCSVMEILLPISADLTVAINVNWMFLINLGTSFLKASAA